MGDKEVSKKKGGATSAQPADFPYTATAEREEDKWEKTNYAPLYWKFAGQKWKYFLAKFL